MAKLTKLNSLMGLGIFLLPFVTWSAQDNANMEVPKDEWLKQIKEVVAPPVCKGFMADSTIAKRLKEINFTYEHCVEKIPAITEQCVNKYYNQLPQSINQQTAGKWGRTLGECIGGEFAKAYLNQEEEPENTSQKMDSGNASAPSKP